MAHISQVLSRLKRDPFGDLPIADRLNQLLDEQRIVWGCVTVYAARVFAGLPNQ